MPKQKRGFTLIELLIVIGIMAVMATLIVLIINPIELFKEARDAQRASDMSQLTNAMELANFVHLPLGSPDTVYVSIPQVGAACPVINLGLTGGYLYSCKADTAYRKVDGTGWLPVDLTKTLGDNTGSIAPFAQLPIDPINDPTDSYFYAYLLSGRRYELLAKFESTKYMYKMQVDEGRDPNFYENGPGFGLWATAIGI